MINKYIEKTNEILEKIYGKLVFIEYKLEESDKKIKEKQEEINLKDKEFEEAFEIIEHIKVYSKNMPISLRETIEEFLLRNSERVYGIKNYSNE